MKLYKNHTQKVGKKFPQCHSIDNQEFGAYYRIFLLYSIPTDTFLKVKQLYLKVRALFSSNLSFVSC